MLEIDDDPTALGQHQLASLPKLWSAITVLRPERFTVEASGMDPDETVLADVTEDEHPTADQLTDRQSSKSTHVAIDRPGVHWSLLASIRQLTMRSTSPHVDPAHRDSDRHRHTITASRRRYQNSAEEAPLDAIERVK
ncbi:hypothetical protein GCM10027167_49530 [Nocardia heshunensis]